MSPTDAARLVASARDTYLRGDFPACVAALEGQTFIEATLRTEALFILARSFLRLHKYRKVIDLLEPTLGAFATLDESCTARMLHGCAVAVGQDVDRGLALLNAAAVFADSPHVHRSIRAELAYYRGTVYWTKREYAESARLAIEAEDAHLDVLSVRATQLRAFVASALSQFTEALRLFERAREAYAQCRSQDVALATQIVYQIAFLEMNLRSADIRGSHDREGGRAIPGTSFGPAVTSPNRMLLLCADAWLYALDGRNKVAVRKSLDAISDAPSSAWRVWALGSGATLAASVGDTALAGCLADEAGALSISIDWNATTDEERVGLLWLAEGCAVVDPSAAVTALNRYDAVTSKMDSTRTLRDAGADPRLAAWEAYVRGLVARVEGDYDGAAEWLRKSAALFMSCSHLWRAARALIELDATLVDTSVERPLERAAIIVRDNFPESFLARRLGWAQIYADPDGRKLTPAQVEVLRDLLQLKSVTEIADTTYRSVSTVRKHVAAIHLAFGTHSITELGLECLRRGLVPAGMVRRDGPRALLDVAHG
jgi:DNA-binding CsgD family transcriptional regulator/tetratricopeptide (TPR) repeat protein